MRIGHKLSVPSSFESRELLTGARMIPANTANPITTGIRQVDIDARTSSIKFWQLKFAKSLKGVGNDEEILRGLAQRRKGRIGGVDSKGSPRCQKNQTSNILLLANTGKPDFEINDKVHLGVIMNWEGYVYFLLVLGFYVPESVKEEHFYKSPTFDV